MLTIPPDLQQLISLPGETRAQRLARTAWDSSPERRMPGQRQSDEGMSKSAASGKSATAGQGT